MADISAVGFLHDLVLELREQTTKPLVSEPSDYQRGYQFGLYVTLHRIQNQAESWGIDLGAIGFGDFDAEKWYLTLPC
jgi:hypothetical protein